MEKTMTIGDFVKEAAFYDMTKDHFEFVKECGELQLMEIYAESVDYVAEHAELSDSELGMLVTEAAAGDKESIGAKIKEKAGKVWDWIVKLFKKVMTAIASFFGKLTKIFPKKRTTQITQLEEACEQATAALDDEAKKAQVVEAVNKMINSVKLGNDQNKDACGEIKASYTCARYPKISKFLKKIGNIEGIDKAEARKAIGMIISSVNDEVDVLVPEIVVMNEALQNAVDTAFAALAKAKGFASPKATTIKNAIAKVDDVINTVGKAKVKSVRTKVDLTEEALEAKSKELNESKETIEGYINHIREEIAKEIDQNPANPDQNIKDDKGDKAKKALAGMKGDTKYATAYAKLQQLLVEWQKSTADTISTYDNIRKVVTANVDALAALVNAVK